MKISPAQKSFQLVSIAHGIIILSILLLSSIPSCSRKPEVINFFDLAGSPASAAASEPEPPAASEPEIKAKLEPKPKPEPKPEKKPDLKPAITNTPPKKVETNAPPKKAEPKKPAATNAPKPAVTNAAKPKTEDEKLAAIRQTTRVRNPNAAPSSSKKPLDLSGLKAALNNASASSGSGSGSATSGTGSGSGGGMYSPFAGYYDSIRQQMYAVWQPGTATRLSATAAVRVEHDGTVSFKSIIRRSGNAQFDQSVQNALNATARLPIPPNDLPDHNIEIVFEIPD